MQVGVIQSVDGLNRTERQRKGEFALCLDQDIHLPLPLDISAPDSEAFGLRGGLTSAPLVLRALGSD